ncbi:hypothetical protein [Bosea sp. 124]|uniref:hypothetical protein n=1 Tax=Bosea sp. 124 TaxID=2135642 RepID=UPI0011B23EBE|nr:hypothetical protein [Bosea sp. 124]
MKRIDTARAGLIDKRCVCSRPGLQEEEREDAHPKCRPRSAAGSGSARRGSRMPDISGTAAALTRPARSDRVRQKIRTRPSEKT